MAEESLKKQTKKGLYWQFLNQFSNYGIQFIIGIFMARLLSPEDYGITALPAVFLAVATIFINGGFGDALIRKPELKEEDLSTMLLYSLGVGVVCYVLLFLASPWIADFYDAPVLKSLMRITALSFLWSPLGTPQFVILRRRLDFKTTTKIGIIGKIVSGITGISLALTGFGLWALVISSIVSDLFGIAMNWLAVRWYPKTGWSKESFKYLWGYGNRIMASYVLNTLYENIVPVVIGKYYSPADLGQYNRAKGYAGMPSVNFTGTLQSVTFPVISKIQDDDEKLKIAYRKMLRTTAFVIFPIMMFLSAIAHPLVILLVTAKWEPCVILLQIMCFSMMWYPIHALNLNLLMVKGRSDLFFRLEVIKKIVGLTLLSITLPRGLIILCYGGIITSILCLIINTYYTGKLIKCGFVRQMGDFSHILILSFIMFGSIIWVISFINSDILQIVTGATLAFLIYVGGAYLFQFEEIEEVKYMLKTRS